MKKNLFDPAVQQATLERIRRLNPDSQRLWGKMTVGQAVCHMTDPFRDVLNLRKSKPAFPRFLQPLMRRMVLVEKDWKPNTPTLKIYKQGGGGGTPPGDFETDKTTLIDLVNQFCAQPDDYPFAPHPGIGQLTREQNGFMMWKHTDHHLRQFGV